MTIKKNHIIRTVFSVTGLLIVSKLLGFVKQMVTAAAFGTTIETDLISLSQGLIGNIQYLLVESVLSALVAVYLHTAQQGEDAARRFSFDLWKALTVITAGVVLLVELCAPWLARLIAPSYPAEQLTVLSGYLRLLAPVLLLLVWIAVFSSLLRANKRFIPAEMLSTHQSIFVIALTVSLSARLGVQSPTARQLDVCRCLLSLDGEDTATLYLQDTKQGVYRFSTAVSAASVKDYLESQDGGNADFARSLGEGYASLSPYTLVFDSVSARRELSAANALSDYPSEELLRRAEFNPHTKDRYVESSGTEVVIEGQRKLYLHPDGMLSYSGGAAEDGSLFAVAAADAAHISRAELCAAARGLVGALTQGRIGDAALFLSGIASDDDGATVFFDYMAGGTPIRFADGSHAAEVRIEGQSITAFSLRLRRYTLTERDSLLLPLALSRAIAQRYPGCELTVAYIDSYGESVGASWIAD